MVGAGADDLILLCAQTFLAPGRKASIVPPTYAMYRIATLLDGAEQVVEATRREPALALQPREPHRGDDTRRRARRARASAPRGSVVVDEAYVEYGGESVVPWLAECPNLIVLRTMSKAFGMPRCGSATRSPRPAPPPCSRRAAHRRRSPPAARIAAAALRDPRFDVGSDVAERERVRAALLAAGYDVLRRRANFVCVRTSDDDLARGSRRKGSSCGASRGASGSRCAGPRRTTCSSRARRRAGPGAGPRGDRHPDEHGDGAADHARPRRQRPVAHRHRNRLPRPPADAAGLSRRLRPRVLAGGDLDVDEHHTVEDVLARFGDALTRHSVAARECALRLRDRADGRGSRHRRGRSRPPAACRDLACLHG